MRSDKHKNSAEFEKLLAERGKEIEEFRKEHGGDNSSKPSFDVASARDEIEKKSVGAPDLKNTSGKPLMKDTTGFSTKEIKEKQVAKKIDENYKKALEKDEELEKQKEKYRAIVQAGNEKNKNTQNEKVEGFVNHSEAAKKNNTKKELESDQPVNDFFEEPKKKATKKKRPGKKKTALVVVLCILILIACAAAGVLIYLNALTGKMDIVNTNIADFDIDAQAAKDLQNYENIAILGVDARKGEGYKGSRSDAIIIARIKKDTGDIQLISVMRDSYLQIEGEDGTKNFDKITHAHAFGGGTDTCKALNRNLDLNISEFVVFNWQAVADLVDAVGGVDVTIESNEIYDLNEYGYESAENVGGTYTPIYTTGKQTLNGAQAVTYCRIRKNSGGDTGRGNRYKEVMEQLLKKAKKMEPSQLNSVANEIFPEIQTNLKKSTMLSMLTKMGSYEIGKTYGWPNKYYGGIINGVWYSVPKTLESNVSWLHEKAFNQKSYKVTEKCKELSKELIVETGISGGGEGTSEE